MSPPTAEAATTQVYTLSVPTEREAHVTTAIELTVPAGFAIDSFAPAPGWKRRVSATGSGEAAVINRVAWSGARIRTGEAALFQFNAAAAASKTYTFRVRQIYDDGTVVDWSGPDGSDTPAPRITAVSSVGDAGTPTLAIAALVLAAFGTAIAVISLFARAGSRPLT